MGMPPGKDNAGNVWLARTYFISKPPLSVQIGMQHDWHALTDEIGGRIPSRDELSPLASTITFLLDAA